MENESGNSPRRTNRGSFPPDNKESSTAAATNKQLLSQVPTTGAIPLNQQVSLNLRYCHVTIAYLIFYFPLVLGKNSIVVRIVALIRSCYTRPDSAHIHLHCDRQIDSQNNELRVRLGSIEPRSISEFRLIFAGPAHYHRGQRGGLHQTDSKSAPGNSRCDTAQIPARGAIMRSFCAAFRLFDLAARAAKP